MEKCLICGDRKANKTNSHIIPSFLIAMVCSYDGSSKRDKEVLVTIDGASEKTYIGDLPDTKINELFENLNDDKIEEIKGNNTAATDYIFCNECEKKLSIYLEGPYAQHIKSKLKITDDIPLMFWISVIWRISVTKNLGIELNPDVEKHQHELIKSYFASKDKNEDVSSIINNSNCRYKIIQSDLFGENNASFISAEYNNDILTVMLGDFLVVFAFCGKELPNDYSYFGIENKVREAIWNDGKTPEQILHVSTEEYKKVIDEFVHKAANEKIKNEKDLINQSLKMAFVSPMPDSFYEQFDDEYIKRLCGENVKLGDKYTYERRMKLTLQILKERFNIPLE
jgi:hypothetical protein